MNATEHTQQTRLLTPAELALCIKLFREMRQWSQEQLATISRLNLWTIQRVEQGLSASLDTRRALANAFEFEDIDAFNTPFTIPSEEEFKIAKEKFDQEHVTLTATPLKTGKQLAKLIIARKAAALVLARVALLDLPLCMAGSPAVAALLARPVAAR